MLKQFLERKGLSYLAKVRQAGLKPAPFLLINYKFAESERWNSFYIIKKNCYPEPWCCLLRWTRWFPSSWRRWRVPWEWRLERSRRWTCSCCRSPSSTRRPTTRCPARWKVGWRNGDGLKQNCFVINHWEVMTIHAKVYSLVNIVINFTVIRLLVLLKTCKGRFWNWVFDKNQHLNLLYDGIGWHYIIA